MHRGAFCQFTYRWIYNYGSNECTRKKLAKRTSLQCSPEKFDIIWHLQIKTLITQKLAPPWPEQLKKIIVLANAENEDFNFKSHDKKNLQFSTF